ncbi:hypothetical protein CANCADRAFT_26739 [Tortispora caseinolytica NRRL Y-17796]|uniref:EF-hand domain-containing protein n=1 Tax=Tortispora caseinolytica NRRL Y-17796 TaxID=767744 RepID=A0A1E4TEM5_9ASCO|nr:hypothetical protein CANCADRAFT_26739 [Tortispora caseinolytica NRRL Y-17796]
MTPEEHAAIVSLFASGDQNKTGFLKDSELAKILTNQDFSRFNSRTVRLMVRIFGNTRQGQLDFVEFCHLWQYLNEWRKVYSESDRDGSGLISYEEFRNALIRFGFRLSDKFIALLFRTFVSRIDPRTSKPAITFDMFVQACITLQRMTQFFKDADADNDGFASFSVETFMSIVLDLTIV